MSKRILVTGGFGFLGAAVANRLADEGNLVTVLDDGSRSQSRRRLIDERRFVIHKADVRRMNFGAKFDSVWHLAAVNGTVNFYKDPYRVLDVQLGGTLRVVRECRAHGVSELVLFSSSEVYNQAAEIPTDERVPLSVPDVLNPRYSYAGSKIASELVALHSGIDRVLVIRPHNVYGPDMGYDHVLPEFVMRMPQSAAGFVVRGDPASTRAFVHVSDFVEGALKAWQYGEKRGVYHVGTEQEVRMDTLAGIVAHYFGYAEPRIIRGEGLEGGPSRRCPNTLKLRALGWSPQVTLSAGVKDFVAWMLENRSDWPKEAA